MKRLLLICAFLLAACDSTAPVVKVVPQADEVQTSQFSAPLGDQSEAQVRIRAPFETVNISALESGGQLIDAQVEHLSEMTFGGVDGVLTLSERNPDETGTRDTPLQWTVGLSPDAALEPGPEQRFGQRQVGCRRVESIAAKPDGRFRQHERQLAAGGFERERAH